VAWCAKLATSWQGVLCDTVHHSLQKPESLIYMGISGEHATEDSIRAQDELATMVFDFVAALLKRKGCSLARTHCKPPWSLGCLLGDVPAVEKCLSEWRAATAAELLGARSAEWSKMLKDLPFLRWPALRLPYMLLERDNGIGEDCRAWLQVLFERKGDSRFAENLFRDLRHGVGKNSNGSTSRVSLHAKLASATTMLHTWEEHALRVDETDLSTAVLPDDAKQVCDRGSYYPKRKQLPESCSRILLPPNAAGWRSHSNEAEDTATMCWLWLQHMHERVEKPHLKASWSSVLLPIDVLVCRRLASSEDYFYILASGSYGAWGSSDR
jgi:hypothetical protein